MRAEEPETWVRHWPSTSRNKNALEFVGGDPGLLDLGGDLHGLAGGCRVQQGLGFGHIELGAHLLRGDGAGGGVIAGVFHVACHGIMNLLGGEGLGGQDRGVHIDRTVGLGGEGFPEGAPTLPRSPPDRPTPGSLSGRPVPLHRRCPERDGEKVWDSSVSFSCSTVSSGSR